MKIAVLTLTRDRLDYTRHCFARLNELAGCEYDHYILDQGSTDATPGWLGSYVSVGPGEWRRHVWAMHLSENVGISRGMNRLLDEATFYEYDLYVKFDNDCELDERRDLAPEARGPGVLARVAAAMTDKWILSPKVEGLNEPPGVTAEVRENGERIGVLGQIGGIFMAVPAWVYQEFRYDEQNPTWGMDDVQLSAWFRERGGRLGYLLDCHVNHYRTTNVQNQEQPAYYQRKLAEMGAL